MTPPCAWTSNASKAVLEGIVIKSAFSFQRESVIKPVGQVSSLSIGKDGQDARRHQTMLSFRE